LWGKAILSTVYGIQADSAENEYIVLAKQFMEKISKYSLPGAALVEIFPSLRFIPSWFPGAGFKKEAALLTQLGEQMMNRPLNHTKSDMEAGRAAPSLTASLLQEGGINESDIKWVSGAMYIAGSDTTASSLATFVMAMVLNPAAQKRAQEEIDRVVGSSRLPSFEDRADLPYIDCIIKETLRWFPAAPLGLPHFLMEDDYYEGHYIPAGSTVLGNIWAMSRDETVYKSPDVFYPERFEGESPEDDPGAFVFGFGRRACVGVHFADSILYIAIVYMLATFDISKAKDETGKEIEPRISFTAGLVNHIDPFPCSIRPRSPQAAALIRGDDS